MDQPQGRLVGPFQQLVLLAVIRIGPDCHGGAVHRYIEHRTGRWISMKAVYTTLQRLESRGFVRSWSRPPVLSRWKPDWKRPGPITLVRAARRFYSAKTAGRRALRLTSLAADRMKSGLPGLGREHELYRAEDPTRSPRPYRFRSKRLQAQYGTWAASDPRWITLVATLRAKLETMDAEDEAEAEAEAAQGRAPRPDLDERGLRPIAWRPMTRPRIALLLPVRAARRTLPQALADVLAQRDVDLSVFAIVDAGDDGADDGSKEILARQARADSRLTVLRGPGRGVGAALDVGLAAAIAAEAPLLAHMEADDRCAPDRLHRLAVALWQRPELCAVTSRAALCGARMPGMRRYLEWQNSLLLHEQLARERFVEIPALHQTGLYRTDAVSAIGGYAPRGPWPADIDFWLRWFEHDACRAPLPTAKLLRVLYRWRQHPRQSTRSHGGDPAAGSHGLDALRAAKAHYLARWLAVGRDGARPVLLLSTGRTLQAWETALRAVGVAVRSALGWRPGEPPPAEVLAAQGEPDLAPARPLVLAAYGSAGVRARLRAALPTLREPDELLFTA
jgi:glycosyltransferase involved in cell wall biosynthesis